MTNLCQWRITKAPLTPANDEVLEGGVLDAVETEDAALNTDVGVYGLNQQEGESGQLKEVKHQLARCAQHLHINITDLSLAGAATSMIFVATKHVFCRDKSMLVATNIFLSPKN